MDYKIEFERLLDFAKQALSGVNIDKREVIGFAGLFILDGVIKGYEGTLSENTTNFCSYSPNNRHFFYEDVIEVCSYCGSRQEDDEIARLRAELVKYKQYVLELDRELQTGESHVEIQG